MTTPTIPSTRRIGYLDSIRGMAALAVVIFHSNAWLDFTKDTNFNSSIPTHILNIFFNGHNAVCLFFVLSGFVLSLKYVKKNDIQEVSYVEFILKRIFRLYPAYWFVLIIAALYTSADSVVFFQELPLLIFGNNTLIPPSWSLIAEMRMSLIFLFLLVLAMRNVKLLFVAAFLFWFLFGFRVYVLHFCLGILLAMNFDKIQQLELSKAKRYVLFFIGFLLCSFEQIHFIIVPHENFKATNTELGFFLGAFGCVIWLVLAMSAPKFQKRIETKPLLFLGDISYGLYIGHWLIFVNILEPHFEWFLSKIGSFYLTHIIVRYGLVIPLSLLFATFLYYVIEKPFIKWGYNIAKKYKDKLVLKLN
ncbi:acyltransferase family protein [Bernardetia sp.]|uniref:acyltransferase family protein n=1 Tax=Bernardetia sp. TaxID=1937974 RepID=UPI0025BA3253|nr:acyltransferase [Bernardetia sp.]